MEDKITPLQVFKFIGVCIAGLALILALIMGGTAAWAGFSVWTKEQDGRAKLAEAQFSKQTKVEEAKANLEAEKLNAEAELIRAKGAAESIQAEAGSLTENYIRYLWVRQQENLNDKTVIYIPTEGGLPLLEAGKR